MSLLERCPRYFVLPVLYYSTALQCGLGCRYSNKTTEPCSQWCPFFNWSVFECDIAHRRYVAVLCMVFKIRCNPIYAPSLSCSIYRMCQCGLHAVLWSQTCILMRLLTAESRSTAGLLFPSQCLCGTIMPTLYSMHGVGLEGFKSRANALSLA